MVSGTVESRRVTDCGLSWSTRFFGPCC